MIDVHMILNGKTVKVTVDDGEILLDTVRERLGLTGTKRGCEVGECGACTVLIDDIPVDSCIYLSAWANGHRVMTIEGVETDGELAAIQQSFIDNGAIQCGFCTPGMVLTAYSLLKRNLHPTTEEIKKGMAGNMCRCAAYIQIADAVQKAGEIMVKAIDEVKEKSL